MAPRTRASDPLATVSSTWVGLRTSCGRSRSPLARSSSPSWASRVPATRPLHPPTTTQRCCSCPCRTEAMRALALASLLLIACRPGGQPAQPGSADQLQGGSAQGDGEPLEDSDAALPSKPASPQRDGGAAQADEP